MLLCKCGIKLASIERFSDGEKTGKLEGNTLCSILKPRSFPNHSIFLVATEYISEI